MGDTRTDDNGKRLLQFLLKSSLINISVGPTRFQANLATAPDRILLSPAISNKFCHTNVTKSLPSDHAEIIITLNLAIEKSNNIIERPNLLKTDWDGYKSSLEKALEEIPVQINNTNAMEDTYSQLTAIIQQELMKAVPVEKKSFYTPNDYPSKLSNSYA